MTDADVIVHIFYPSSQTLRMRSAPSVDARVRAAIYPDPDIEWQVVAVCESGGNYWGKLGHQMWFALKFNGQYFSDWRE
jgi:hypothetical protein